MEKKIFIPPPAREIQLLTDHPHAFKRVLIMENDPEQKKALEDYLAAHHFEAVFVKSALQGLHEIRDHDFDLVICNMIDSVFAGEMFYKAVQRVKPQLCRRFIFMSDRNIDAANNAFIRDVHGVKLWKPYEWHILLETIQLVLRKAARPPSSGNTTVFTQTPSAPVPSPLPVSGCCPVRSILALTCLAFAAAKKSIHFTTTHFSPDQALINGLIQASQCGVQVEILVPTKTEKHVRNMIPAAVQQKFLDAGIRLLEGRFTVVTSRLIVIDEQWACTTHSDTPHENINVYTGAMAQKLFETYQKYKASAQAITEVEAEPVTSHSSWLENPISNWSNLVAAVANRFKLSLGF